MANRRISDLQELAGINLADDDLLTVVDVGEVDPAIKNKKLTISGTKAYLNIYYISTAGGTVNGSLRVVGTLDAGTFNVSGNANITGVISGTTITGTTFNAVTITTQSFTTNSFSSPTITGVSGTFTDRVSGLTVTGITGAFSNLIIDSGTVAQRLNANTLSGTYGSFGSITGVSGVYTLLSGATITGQNLNIVSGIFSNVTTTNLVGTTVSGDTVTGTQANFTNVTGVNIVGTTQVSGLTVTGDTGGFVDLAADSASFTEITGGTFYAGGATFVTGSGDVRPYGLYSFPSLLGTSGYVLQTNANGTTQWVAQSTSTGGGGGYSGGDFTVYNGNLIVSGLGSGIFESNVEIQGNLSGVTAAFLTITGSFLKLTQPSGSSPALICSGVISGDTNGVLIQGPLVILP